MKPGLCLTHRKNGNAVHVLGTPLGIRIKVTHGIQLITKEFRAHRHVCGGGENIQNTAANRKLSGTFHHTASAVTGCGKPTQKFIHLVFLAGFQGESGVQQHLGRHGSLAERFPGENLDRCVAPGQIV